MRRLKLMATVAAGLLASVAMASSSQAATLLVLDSSGDLLNYSTTAGTYTALPTVDAGLVGLGQLGTTVYGESGNQLFTINTTSGAETLIGTSGVTATSFIDFGSTTGALYAVGGNGDLYTISNTTGLATLDGSLGLGTLNRNNASRGPATVTSIGLSTGSSTLYFSDGITFYSLNTTTGATTMIGTFSTTAGSAQSPLTDFGGFTTEGAILYAGANSDNHGAHTALGSLNPATAQVTFLAETSPNNSASTQFIGIVPGSGFDVPLPEPSEWALMLLGVGAVGGVLRSRRRRVTASV